MTIIQTCHQQSPDINMHTIRTILKLFIFFRFFLILLFQMAVHMRRLEDDQNGPKGKLKNKRRTQMTQDQLPDTDTQQQNSEH